jgi:sulfur-carrier protein
VVKTSNLSNASSSLKTQNTSSTSIWPVTQSPLALAASLSPRYNPLMGVSQTVCVKVLFFGRLKDVLGRAEDSLDCRDISTIEQLFAAYAARIPELGKYRSSVVASRNREFAPWDTPLHAGDEVAFLPPVSGG